MTLYNPPELPANQWWKIEHNPKSQTKPLKTPRRDKYEEPDVKGVIAAKTLNPTDPNPGFTTAPFHVIVEVAKAHGVKPLSINWPDKYSPDFTGVPTDG